MTTPAQNAQAFAAASFGAWMSVTNAWIKAVNDVWAVVAEWAVDEEVYADLNQAVVFVAASHACDLTAELSRVGDPTGALLPADAVVIDPLSIDPTAVGGPSAKVRVTIKPIAGVRGPAYCGRLVDEHGTEVEPDLYVPILVDGPSPP